MDRGIDARLYNEIRTKAVAALELMLARKPHLSGLWYETEKVNPGVAELQRESWIHGWIECYIQHVGRL